MRAGSKAQAAGAAGKEQSQRIRAEKNALALQVLANATLIVCLCVCVALQVLAYATLTVCVCV